MKPVRIIIPEYQNSEIQKALQLLSGEELEILDGNDLSSSLERLKSSEADAMVAGADYTTRDVILACRDTLGVAAKTFSSCVYFEKEGFRPLILADSGVTKNPDVERLADIVCQTYETALKLLDEEPHIAMLSFSTTGSARDESIDKIREAITRVREVYPEMKIDGEMQLDAAVNSRVAARKMPGSDVAGRANVLIVPDLNSGNILYKALEQFGGFTAAGPILQGFNKPVSDLSRGSTAEDIALTVRQMAKLV